MFARDILPDLSKALGNCPDDYAFRRLTDAVNLLANKNVFNPTLGELAVCVCNNFATLPPEVKTVLGITVDGCPAILRDQWFIYSINGPGDTGFTPFSFAQVLGHDFCTIRDPESAVKLGARIRNASDQNKQLRIFGWDANGERILSSGPDGNKEDGFLVPLVFGRVLVNSEAPAIAKIDRVYKDETSDMVDLFAIDPTTLEATSLLGRYRPKETAPSYMRIRVPEKQVVRVKYKRRVFDVEDQYTWLPIENRQALIHAIRAVKFYLDGKYGSGQEAEGFAVRVSREEKQAEEPGGIHPPQVINNELPRETAGSNMFYGPGNYGWERVGY